MKKIIVILISIIITLIGFLVYFISNIDPDIKYYQEAQSNITQIFGNNTLSKEEKSEQVMNIMLNAYNHKSYHTKRLNKFYEWVIIKSLTEDQYVDIQILLYYYELSQEFGNQNFTEIKDQLIKQNLVFSFHDNFLLTKEMIGESLERYRKNFIE